jgi:hypothetical protein
MERWFPAVNLRESGSSRPAESNRGRAQWAPPLMPQFSEIPIMREIAFWSSFAAPAGRSGVRDVIGIADPEPSRPSAIG